MDTVAGIARLYTDLVSLNEDVLVKQQVVRLAERLSEDNRNQLEQGAHAPVEATRANASLAASRQALINAEGLVRQQELILKTALTRRGLDDPRVLEAHIVPTDTLTAPEKEQFQPVPDLVKEALRNRPDLEGAGIQVENSQISLKGSLNAVKPQLNLVGNVQNSGLAGSPNPLAPMPAGGVATGGIGAALGQVIRRDFPSCSIGVQLVVPVRNRIAQADAVRDALQVRQSQVRRQAMEDQIRLEVAPPLSSLTAPTGVGFLAIVSPSGADPTYLSYLGGSLSGAAAVALDSSGNIYVTGNSVGTSFPLTATAGFQGCPEAQDRDAFAFVIELSRPPRLLFGSTNSARAPLVEEPRSR